MRCLFLCLVMGGMVAPVSAVCGDMIAPAPIPERMGRADVVVVGKVTSIEEKTVKAAPFWGGTPVEFKIGVVKIEQQFKGQKGVTHLKVAFLPPFPGGTRISRPATHLAVGQEVLLFLTKHPDESFYLMPMYFDLVEKQRALDFDKQVTMARQCGKLLAEPEKGLQAKEATERMLTAAMLLVQYRQPPPYLTGKKVRWEPIPVEQSKRILHILAEADWNKPDPQLGYQLSPQALFQMLARPGDDGPRIEGSTEKFVENAQRWLKANADRHRLKRWIAEK